MQVSGHSFLLSLVIAVGLFAVGEALKCYQSQSTYGAPLTGSPIECPVSSAPATGCTKFVTNNQVMRACDYYNCQASTFVNGPNTCSNTTNNNGFSTNCCCTGDSCNSATAYSLATAIAVGTLGFLFS